MFSKYDRTTIDVIREAMKRNHSICFHYVDAYHRNGEWKNAEPWLLGIHKKTGNFCLRAWFLPTPAQRAKGKKEGWRLYIIPRIKQVSINQYTTIAATRKGYNSLDSDMEKILVHRIA